jgi:hypothetical protein
LTATAGQLLNYLRSPFPHLNKGTFSCDGCTLYDDEVLTDEQRLEQAHRIARFFFRLWPKELIPKYGDPEKYKPVIEGIEATSTALNES